MDVFEFLRQRSEYEIAVVSFKIPGIRKHGTLENMKWFVENGAQRNRFREGFDVALTACESVINSLK